LLVTTLNRKIFHFFPYGELDPPLSTAVYSIVVMTKNTNASPYMLTTPIYYVNAKPHLGHAYTTIMGDFLKKLALIEGKRVLFVTGTDEHGEKIVQKATAEGKTPKELVDEVSSEFRSAWEKLALDVDVFYRTTQPDHYKMVQNALQFLKDKGDIYFAEYEGKYCVGCERFRTDSEWNEEGLCPDHQTPPDLRKEPNYFFKMGSYQKELIKHYESNLEAIEPSQYRQEVLSFLKQPLEDLNISRPKTRLTWGIELPFDKDYVTYVWFDALLNYLGAIGYEGGDFAAQREFKNEFWAESHHLIGKDILKTHAIYWPTMLMGLEVPVFKKLHVGGFWMNKGLKMSKSLGNVVDPIKVSEHFGVDFFRYFLLREMSFGSDANFTWEAFIARCNSELANGLGNLASRVLKLSQKNFEMKIPSASGLNDQDKALVSAMKALPAKMAQEFEQCRYHIGIGHFNEAVAECDRYINDNKPWVLAKDPEQKDRLASVLRTAMEALHVFSIVSYPLTPEASLKLQEALGQSGEIVGALFRVDTGLDATRSLTEVPQLFPRLELPDLE